MGNNIGQVIVMALAAIIGILCLAALIGILVAFPVMWTWNATMPYLFNLKTIGWGQAWCLLFLSACLLKGNSSSVNKD